jgi:RimJ/RimL family protein N-acetyltransferase
MKNEVYLRAVAPADLPIFFEQQQDSDANWMAAFTPKDPADRAAFDAHWARILSDPAVRMRTIGLGPAVAGSVGSYAAEGRREVTYWIGRAFWGRGVATQALRLFLAEEPARPLAARAAGDNLASIRVLAKCGFRLVGAERGFANARGAEIDEVVMVLEGPAHLD